MRRRLASLGALLLGMMTNGFAASTVVEEARKIPVAYTVDVIVVGGTTRGVAAAVAAKKAGARVFLMAERPYLGEDLCATWRLWLGKGEKPSDALGKAIFGETGSTTPMNAKRQLDKALLDAGIPFLFGSYATDVLQDKDGRLAGVVMANRSGRQAVMAKVIIDATERAIVTRIAGAEFAPFPRGKHTFKRVVVGGKPGASAVRLDHTLAIGGLDQKTLEPKKKKADPTPVYEYTLELPMADGSWSAFANADRLARDQTWHDGQVAASERLFQVPPDPVCARKRQMGTWPGADKVEIDTMRPKSHSRLYVLGGCADISRAAAAALLRPLNGMTLARRVGAAAAEEAQAIEGHQAAAVTVRCEKASATSDLVIGEMLQGTRSRAPLAKQSTVLSPSRTIPVLAKVDVVVVGGGTGGAPAGIGAARAGAKTLVVEYLHGLGGIGTLGKISAYWHGCKVGFTREVSKATGSNSWNSPQKMEWLRKKTVDAGGTVWFNSLGCGAVVRGKRVVGVVVATPLGRGVVLSNSVVDGTGNAVIPFCAGAPTTQIGAEHIRVQGTGLAPSFGDIGWNTDWAFNDDDDVVDMWRLFVVGKNKYAQAFDMNSHLNTRSRRQIIGDIVITPLDIWNKRTYPDTISRASSNYDNHGFTIHNLFLFMAQWQAEKSKPGARPGGCGLGGISAYLPYRALLPAGYDGVLSIGLGISAHCDAMPILRMQADVQNHGYAAGKAAAMAAQAGTTVRNIDVKALQKHLVEIGVLDKAQLTDKDSYPFTTDEMKKAVKDVGVDYTGISKILVDPKVAMPLLRTAYRQAATEEVKLRYAHVLGLLYDDTAVETLLTTVKNNPWDKGKRFVYWGMITTAMENLIIALGRTGDKRGLPVIIAKLNELKKAPKFSQCRAAAYALEEYGDPIAAQPLADLLSVPGVSGHAIADIDTMLQRTPVKTRYRRGNDNTMRNNALREIMLARALYRCGDHNGLAEKILREYAKDLRGHYAAHAKAILQEKRRSPSE